jgi:hypothetical protein
MPEMTHSAHPMPSASRRHCLKTLACALTTACSPEPDVQAQRKARLCLPHNDPQYDLGGLSLMFDAMDGETYYGVEFYADEGLMPFFASHVLELSNVAHMGVDVRHVPKTVRVVHRVGDKGASVPLGDVGHYDSKGQPLRWGQNPEYFGNDLLAQIEKRKAIYAARGETFHGPWSSGYGEPVVGDYTITVAERIPKEAFDELCQRGGGLGLKFRLHKSGVFMGWDIGRPSNAPWPAGEPRPEGTVLFGGDFREARIWEGKPVRKGWYIHPKTQQRIETDF